MTVEQYKKNDIAIIKEKEYKIINIGMSLVILKRTDGEERLILLRDDFAKKIKKSKMEKPKKRKVVKLNSNGMVLFAKGYMRIAKAFDTYAKECEKQLR